MRDEAMKCNTRLCIFLGVYEGHALIYSPPKARENSAGVERCTA
jgi:hypothetical protein